MASVGSEGERAVQGEVEVEVSLRCVREELCALCCSSGDGMLLI